VSKRVQGDNTEGELTMRNTDYPGEESIVWEQDPATLPYVRETLAYAGTRQRPVRWRGPGRRVGYAVPRADARSGHPGTFTRRVFWVKPYDRSEAPDGIYRTGCPSEGVDPLTVAPGVPGEQTARAWNCAETGYPHGGDSPCDLCGR
jgi:hypothetical protein